MSTTRGSPDTTRARVHIVLATCVEDVDEMENHYNKAQRLWTLINARCSVGENLRFDQRLREARAQLDAVVEAIEDERNDETEQSNSTNASTELTMSAIAVVESVPAPDFTSISSHHSSNAGSEATSQSSMNAIAVAESVMSLRPSEFVPAVRPTSTFSARSSSQDDTEPDMLLRPLSPPRQVRSVMTGSRLFGPIASPGHRELPGHVGMSPASILKLVWDSNRTIRGRTVVKLSRTLPSRLSKRRASSTSETASENTLKGAPQRFPSSLSKRPPTSPSKTLPSSPSKSPTPARDTEQYSRSMLEPTSPTPARRDKEQYFKSMFEPPSPCTSVAGSKERNGDPDRRNLSPPKLKLPKGSGRQGTYRIMQGHV
ncbi:hypothetical protein KCU91_g12995, partial [Aureobasidium melanogenum]